MKKSFALYSCTLSTRCAMNQHKLLQHACADILNLVRERTGEPKITLEQHLMGETLGGAVAKGRKGVVATGSKIVRILSSDRTSVEEGTPGLREKDLEGGTLEH
eukprot:SAG25_NODE_1759_length_2385_cov_154.022544_1_plen_103_part_10